MADGRVHRVRDDSGAFRLARRAGMGGAPNPMAAIVMTAGAVGMEVYFVVSALSGEVEEPFSLGSVLFFLFPLAFGALLGTSAVRETSVLLRMRRAWRRARHGEAVRVLAGVALRRERSVAGYPVRTVVAQVNGRAQFVRLAFARPEHAAMLPPGPVQLDLFDGPAIRGPARLRPLSGGVAWAFASRSGDLAVSEETLFKYDGRPGEEPDGWPDSDGGAERGSGWPGDSGGDGDGDGGE
ncbi:hypothetical protein [Nonomuraea candida]|uniref:hypothetical protein n=1 Tax=Nonomuraea candida TaxID=359159 RepID=UPI0005BAE4E3|nr:hypothetical protein [Nonomuraea candida]